MTIDTQASAPSVQKVLVGFDFSDQATTALHFAVDLARTHGAALDVVVAVPGHMDGSVIAQGVDPVDEVTTPPDAIDHVRAQTLEAVSGVDTEGIELTCHVTPGKPARALFEASRESDLVVVGATGLGAWGRIFIGSTARRLVHESPQPVLVVKPDQAWPPEVILCPVDFEAPSLAALQWSAALARTWGASLVVQHVVETVPRLWLEVSGVMYEEDFQRAEVREHKVRQERLQALLDDPSLDGLIVTSRVDSGQPEACIIEAAEDVEADLVCIGSVGRSGLEGIFVGNTAERLLSALPCSMLTVKAEDFKARW